ncbi:MAG: divalent metal cation transporter [Opitutaceae bacterium]|nr:divalent metal cation transporter [Opitutaceae bacterium]
MQSSPEQVAAEKQLLREARAKGGLATAVAYLKCSGPGWLQGAITLGGGSLAGSLYLGVIGGYSLLWLQVLAMAMGVIMLSAITYVTLSTGKRPFHAIKDHINPVLAWGWAIATLVANIVWCMPQFSLATAAILQNLAPSLPETMGATGSKVAVCLLLLTVSIAIIWLYDSGHRGVKIFELILKLLVAVVVICFFGVVFKIATSTEGLAWSEVMAGFVPDLSLLSQPAATFNAALAATGNYAGHWSALIVADQRDIMITAAATAVGINMTFLLPYSLLKKGWDKESRGLAIFDLSTGLLIPFVLATSCVVIAAASQFHVKPQPGVIDGRAPAVMIGQYNTLLTGRLKAEIGLGSFNQLSPEGQRASLAALPEGDKQMAAMLLRRDAFNLASALERLTGKTVAHYVFGIGVLAMALSTIVMLMLISGFTVTEVFGLPQHGWPHRLGCLLAGIGVLGPFIYSGKTQFWLAVPTSVFGMTLLPIAYFTFFLMMNNRSLMGGEILRGGKRTLVNLLMLATLLLAGFGAGWAIWSKTQWIGVGAVAAFVALAVVVHFVRPPKKVAAETSP